MILSCSNVFICPVSELSNYSTSLLPQSSDALVIPGAGRWLELDICQSLVIHNQTSLKGAFRKKSEHARSRFAELRTVYTRSSKYPIKFSLQGCLRILKHIVKTTLSSKPVIIKKKQQPKPKKPFQRHLLTYTKRKWKKNLAWYVYAVIFEEKILGSTQSC